ncbi:hypothetical protein C8A00DRAFT_31802 [Chaetomidium leptoderma]|uniref:Uncharacterized protein n=1 Tax=Chaetomidium leptoderma TaxID=669021 RepID=A0AAN6ZYZ5_9PEZI|nr:hypothetical protein C8A00DRAFT_31802 [Chaetomidium leptoderma]
MDKVSNELRSMIVRFLPDQEDRNALVVAYPDWKATVQREDSLRTLSFDPTGENGEVLEEFLDLFDDQAIRRRQFLQKVKIDMALDVNDQGCCAAGHVIAGESEYFSDAIRSLLEALNEISERLADETELPLTPMSLALIDCQDYVGDNGPCSNDHEDEETRAAEIYRDVLTLTLPDDAVPEVKGVDRFSFCNRNVLLFLEPTFILPLVKRLVDLRVLDLEYNEEVQWTREYKEDWSETIAKAVGEMPNTLPLEEFRLRLGRNSPRNEFLEPSRRSTASRADRTTLMFRHLSTFEALTVLWLSGQFCIPAAFFDTVASATTPFFPALTTFHLEMGPDTCDGDWFFIKDETEQAWEKAAEDPEWTNYVKFTAEGIFPADPAPDYEPTSDDEGYWPYMESREREYDYLLREPVKRNRTLPNDATMGPMLRGAAGAMARMAKIETFSVCLGDIFDEDECKSPFVPPFITRTFALRFVKKPEGKSGPTLTWELGQKIDHWRPAEDVLEAWKAAAGEESGLEVSFVE